MSREEAKTWLNKLYARADITDEYGDMEDMQPYEEALDIAIKALEQEPKSEWEHDHEILKAYSDGANDMLYKIRAEIEPKCDRINSLASVLPYTSHREIQELLCEIMYLFEPQESEVSDVDSN